MINLTMFRNRRRKQNWVNSVWGLRRSYNVNRQTCNRISVGFCMGAKMGTTKGSAVKISTVDLKGNSFPSPASLPDSYSSITRRISWSNHHSNYFPRLIFLSAALLCKFQKSLDAVEFYACPVDCLVPVLALFIGCFVLVHISPSLSIQFQYIFL